MTDDPYTSKPTHLRIYWEETGDEWPWHLDGADNEGRYTTEVRTYSTFAEAMNSCDLFVTDLESEGVRFEFTPDRKTTRIRPEPKNHIGHYTSQDLDGGTWSVYREEYKPTDLNNPIDDLTIHIGTWDTEDEAEQIAKLLQKGVNR